MRTGLVGMATRLQLDNAFSPRRSNLEDLQRLGCPKVHYLPFGYDESPFASSVQSSYAHDVLFVGAPTLTGRRL